MLSSSPPEQGNETVNPTEESKKIVNPIYQHEINLTYWTLDSQLSQRQDAIILKFLGDK